MDYKRMSFREADELCQQTKPTSEWIAIMSEAKDADGGRYVAGRIRQKIALTLLEQCKGMTIDDICRVAKTMTDTATSVTVYS